MRVSEELVGKLIVDASGNEVGKVDDAEFDLESRSMIAIVVKGKGILSKQFQSERIDSLMKKIRISKTDDLMIPFEEVQAVGKYVVLKKAIALDTQRTEGV
jgi:sporulation protein YlmC with PRC-barrel domain